MALPAQPGAPTPTPTPRPVAPGVSAGDYLASQHAALLQLNQSATLTVGEFTTWFGKEVDVVKDSET